LFRFIGDFIHDSWESNHTFEYLGVKWYNSNNNNYNDNQKITRDDKINPSLRVLFVREYYLNLF